VAHPHPLDQGVKVPTACSQTLDSSVYLSHINPSRTEKIPLVSPTTGKALDNANLLMNNVVKFYAMQWLENARGTARTPYLNGVTVTAYDI
jgi:hypothetical protein